MTVRSLIVFLLLMSCALTGCRSMRKSLAEKVPHRTAAEKTNTPLRKDLADQDDPFDAGDGVESSDEDKSDIALAEFSPDKDKLPVIDSATVVATVNSMPIFADEVLGAYSRELNQIEKQGQMRPEELGKLKMELIQRSLPAHIEKTALVSTLLSDLKDEQRKKLDEQLDRAWERETQNLMAEFKVGTRIELDRALEKQGTTLAGIKPGFVARELAMLHVSQKSKAPDPLTPEQLRQWYEDNKATTEFLIVKEKIRWQEIRISHNKAGGKSEAAIQLRAVRAALQRGDDFGTVARKYSDSPKAEQDGIWEWAPRGTLADTKLEDALFQAEVNHISVMETKNATIVFKVLDHIQPGYRPFDEVKDDINRKLSAEQNEKRVRDFIDAQIARSTVWTIFDDQSGQSALKQVQ